MMNLTPVVRTLLIINVMIFIFQGFAPNIWPQFALYSFHSPYFKPFQLASYMFLHGGWEHLFSNMLGLFMFGPLLEGHILGQQRFLTFYFVTAIGGGVVYLLFNYFELQNIADPVLLEQMYQIPTVGASGAILGIIAAFGLVFPNLEMQLFLIPMPIKAKYFVTMYAIIELYSGVVRTSTGIAHFAHLGGMVFAFLLLKWWRIGRRF